MAQVANSATSSVELQFSRGSAIGLQQSSSADAAIEIDGLVDESVWSRIKKVSKPDGPSDDFSLSQLNFQLRYRWQIAPLSDLFVVYTKGDSRRTFLSDFDALFENSWDNPLGDSLVIKLRYRLGT